MRTANGDGGLVAVSDDEEAQTEAICDRPDLWNINKCVVCQSKHFSEPAKRRHVRMQAHKNRVAVYDFFLNEVQSFKSSKTASTIAERVGKSSDSFIGVECIHEFIFTEGGDHYWACSVCYCAGTNIDDVTVHLSSNSHRMNYIEEFHPDRKPKGRTAKEISAELGHATEAIVAARTTAPVPEVLELNIHPCEAAKKLGLGPVVVEERIEPIAIASTSTAPSSIASRQVPVGFRICGPSNVDDEARLLQCESCWEVIRVASTEQIEKEWEKHLATTRHEQRSLLRKTFVFDASTNLDEPSQLEGALKPGSRKEWEYDTLTSTWLFKGRIVGLEYLVERVERFDILKRAKRDVVCLLCLQEMPIAPLSIVQTHVRSESHIVAFLYKEMPTVAEEMLRANMSNRREFIGDFLAASNISKGKVRVCRGVVSCIESVTSHTTPTVATAPPKVEENGVASIQNGPRVTTLEDGDQAIWCEACWQVLFVPTNSKDADSNAQICWQKHAQQQSHINLFIKRKLFDFAEENFVHGQSCLTAPPIEEHGHWTVTRSMSKKELHENQANVGLDFIIERHRADQSVDVVCLLCAEIMPCSDNVVHRHVQSEQHVVQFLHSSNIPMVKLLSKQQSEAARGKVLLDYLKKTPPESGTFRIYHPQLAAALRHWGSVSACSLKAALMPDEQRDVFLVVAELVDSVCEPTDAPSMIPLKDALAEEGLKVLRVEDDDILFWCSACWQTLVAPIHQSPVDQIWFGHLRSADHQKKKAQRQRLLIDDRGFVQKEKSQFKVADISKVAGSEKKRAWLRGKDGSDFEFVYRIVGLNQVIDRRSIDASRPEESDLFCVMCLQSMPRRTAELTAHVRSTDHVLQYMHKYCPVAIRQLDKHPLKDSELRTFITSAIRSLPDDHASFVRVYDPVGVQSKQKSQSSKSTDAVVKSLPKLSRISDIKDVRPSKTAVHETKNNKHKRPRASEKSSSNTSSEAAVGKDAKSKTAVAKKDSPNTTARKPETKVSDKTTLRTEVIQKLLNSINEEIADNQLPSALNANICAVSAGLGANLVYEVTCTDDVHFKSYFCSICSAWETADQIIKHLLSDGHRLTFLNIYYKMHYKAVMNLTNEAAKSGALKQYAVQIEQIEGRHQVTRRLRYQLDASTLSKLWPGYRNTSAHSRREQTKRPTHSRSMIDPPPPGLEDKSSSFALPVWPDNNEIRRDLSLPSGTGHSSSYHRYSSSSVNYPPVRDTAVVSEHPAAVAYENRRSRGGRSRSRSSSPSAKRSRRPASPKYSRGSPSPDRAAQIRRPLRSESSTDDRRRRMSIRNRSRSRSRSPSRPKRRHSPEHRRSSPAHRRHSRSRSRSPSPADRYSDMRPRLTTTATTNALSWDQKAAMFLEQIGDTQGAHKLLTSKPPPSIVSTQQSVDMQQRFAPVQRKEWEQNRHSDSFGSSAEELLGGFIDSSSTISTQQKQQESSQLNSEQLLSSLLNEKRVAATEQLLIKLLLEEREKQKRQEEEQKILIKAFSETVEKRTQQTKVVDYGHQSTSTDFSRTKSEPEVPMQSPNSKRLEAPLAMTVNKNVRSPEADLVRDAELNAIRARAFAAVASNSARNAESAATLAAEREQRERAEAEKLARLVQSGAVSWSGLQQLMEKVKNPEQSPQEPAVTERRRDSYDPFSDYDYLDQPVYRAPERREHEHESNRSYPMPSQPQRNADSNAVYPGSGSANQWSSSNQTTSNYSTLGLPPPPPPSTQIHQHHQQQQKSAPLSFMKETVMRPVRATPAVFGASRPPSLMSVHIGAPVQPTKNEQPMRTWGSRPSNHNGIFFPRQ